MKKQPRSEKEKILNLDPSNATATLRREKLSFSTISDADRPQLKRVLFSAFAYRDNEAVAEDAYASIDGWLRQKALARDGVIDEKRLLYELEYHALKNISGEIIAIAGIYTVQTSAPGFNAATGSWSVARLGWTGVISKERRKGYGKLIVELEIKEAKRKGASVFLVETSPLWENMHPLLKKLGFRSDANVKNYYGKGVNMLCLYSSMGKVNTREIAARMVETYDLSQLEWLKPFFGEKKFSWLLEVVEKAAYTKKIDEVFQSLVKATPYVIKEEGKPIGFALLSTHSWEGAAANAPRATFLCAHNSKEEAVAMAIVRKAKELGTRMLLVEMPKGEKPQLEKAFEELDFVSSPVVQELYGTYSLGDQNLDVDQVIFAMNLS